jgi:hypothetical protein
MAQAPVKDVITAINNAIEDIIFDVALSALKTFAVTELPWLGLPLINPLFNLLVNWIGGYFYTFLSQIADLEVVTIQTTIEATNYTQAIAALQAAYTSGDPTSIATSTTSVKSALAALIHFDVSLKRKSK